MFVTMSRFKSRPIREVIAMMTPPSPRTLDTSSDKARTLSHVANQDLLHEGYFKQSELRSDFATAVSAGCDLFDTTVHISPSDLVKRHCTQRYGIVTESIYAPARSRIEIRYDAPAHLLVLYEDGVRREGETSIDGLPPSTLRNFANKLTFVPALASVLAHELSRSGRELARTSAASRGGLASWQKRAVIGYIEELLDERVSLITLARLARLSQHHFCRAFKQSFGTPPQGYLLQRRIERAKVLLSDRANSITDVALTLGYAFNSSFTLAFRKITGQTPSEFRRNVT